MTDTDISLILSDRFLEQRIANIKPLNGIPLKGRLTGNHIQRSDGP